MQRRLTLRLELVLLAGVILAAAFLRFWQLDNLPPGYHYDEAFEGLEAHRLLTEPTYRPLFFTGNFGVEPMFIYMTAFAFNAFGESPAVQRGVAALIGLLTVPGVWLFVSELRRWNVRVPETAPLWSAFIQAALFWTVSASRIGYEPGLVPLLLCVLLWALLVGLRTGKRRAWVLAGAICGLGPYTYPAGRLFFAVAGVTLVLAWLWPKLTRNHTEATQNAATEFTRRKKATNLVLFSFVALTVFAPLGLHWASTPDLLLLRSRQIAVTGEGAGSSSPLKTTAEHTLATLGMFSVAGDTDPRNNLPGRPVFDAFLAPFFYLGALICLARWKNLTSAWLFAVFGVMLAPTVLSEYAPHFRRALGAAPLVATVTGIGLGAAWAWASQHAALEKFRQLKFALRVVIVVAALASGITTARTYFAQWASSPDLFYAFDEGLWQLGQAVNALPTDATVYETPRPATHTTLAFAWRNTQAPSTFDGRHIFVVPPNSNRATFYAVVDNEDFRTRLLLPELFPSAQKVHTILDRAGQLYATVYSVAPNTSANIQPQTKRDDVWNDQARLLGVNVPANSRAGDVIYVRLFWEVRAAIGENWTFFVHLLDENGNNVLGHDAQPGNGSYATSRWRAGERVIDEIQLAVPPNFSPGTYAVEAGFYREDGSRVALTSGADHAALGTLRIEPAQP